MSSPGVIELKYMTIKTEQVACLFSLRSSKFWPIHSRNIFLTNPDSSLIRLDWSIVDSNSFKNQYVFNHGNTFEVIVCDFSGHPDRVFDKLSNTHIVIWVQSNDSHMISGELSCITYINNHRYYQFLNTDMIHFCCPNSLTILWYSFIWEIWEIRKFKECRNAVLFAFIFPAAARSNIETSA